MVKIPRAIIGSSGNCPTSQSMAPDPRTRLPPVTPSAANKADDATCQRRRFFRRTKNVFQSNGCSSGADKGAAVSVVSLAGVEGGGVDAVETFRRRSGDAGEARIVAAAEGAMATGNAFEAVDAVEAEREAATTGRKCERRPARDRPLVKFTGFATTNEEMERLADIEVEATGNRRRALARSTRAAVDGAVVMVERDFAAIRDGLGSSDSDAVAGSTMHWMHTPPAEVSLVGQSRQRCDYSAKEESCALFTPRRGRDAVDGSSMKPEAACGIDAATTLSHNCISGNLRRKIRGNVAVSVA